MSRLRFAAAVICAMMASSASLPAQGTTCTGSSDLPPPGGSGPVCSKGKIIIAATGSAPVRQAANMPYQIAVKIARKEADLHAREMLAKFLNDNKVSSDDLYSESVSIENKTADLKITSKTNSSGSVDGDLPPGVAVIAVNIHDGTMYVTVAISSELQG
jgi:hypothetical protein